MEPLQHCRNVNFALSNEMFTSRPQGSVFVYEKKVILYFRCLWNVSKPPRETFVHFNMSNEAVQFGSLISTKRALCRQETTIHLPIHVTGYPSATNTVSGILLLFISEMVFDMSKLVKTSGRLPGVRPDQKTVAVMLHTLWKLAGTGELVMTHVWDRGHNRSPSDNAKESLVYQFCQWWCVRRKDSSISAKHNFEVESE